MNISEVFVCGFYVPLIFVTCRNKEWGLLGELAEGGDMVVIHVAVRDENGVDILHEKLINGHARLPPSPEEEEIMRVLTQNRVCEDFDTVHFDEERAVTHKRDFG